MRAKAKKLRKALDTLAEDGLKYGVKVAAVLLAGRQPGRLFSTEELEMAVDVAVDNVKDRLRDEWSRIGVPAEIETAIVATCAKTCRAAVRRGLFEALPADVIAMEGTG